MEWQVPRISSDGMSIYSIETNTPTILKKQDKNVDTTKSSSSTYGKKQSISSSASKASASRKLSNSSSATSSSSGSSRFQIPQYDTNYQHRSRPVTKTTTRKSIQHTTSKSYDEEDDDNDDRLNNQSHKNQRNSDYSDRSDGIISKASEDDGDDIDDNDSFTGTATKTIPYKTDTDSKHVTNTASISNKKKTTPTIGLFGAYGSTGNHFLKLALDAGYNVQAMLLPSVIVHVRSNGGKKLKKKTITSSSLQEEFIDYATMSSSCNTLHDKVNNQGDKIATNSNNNRLEWIKSKRIDDVNNIKRTIDNVDYVVCMLSDTIHSDDDKNSTKNKVGPLLNFIQLLYPLMNDTKTIQAFLYQTTSLANDIYGMTPMLSKCMKSITNKKSYYSLRDHDKSIQQISFYHFTQYNNIDSTTFVVLNSKNDNKKGLLKKAKIGLDDGNKEETEDQENIDENDENKRSSILSTTSTRPPTIRTLSCSPHFSYIITRPTSYVIDGPSKHALVSSKSQPGPCPITHIDLAEFSLNALLNKKLYNSCPYVVAENNK